MGDRGFDLFISFSVTGDRDAIWGSDLNYFFAKYRVNLTV
jgi:hypothetical protein